MQQLQNASDCTGSPVDCAESVLAAVPHMMRFIRSQMRANRLHQLTVPQFRALVFASVQDNPSLSALAEHIGLSLPAASRMVELLVRRGLMVRRAGQRDRRLVSLSLTPRGRAVFQRSRRATQVALALRFRSIPSGERVLICRAMRVMGHVFALTQTPDAGPRRRHESRVAHGATP